MNEPLPEDFLARRPELGDYPEAAADLIYEELCLRQEYGPEVSVAAGGDPRPDLGRGGCVWRVLISAFKMLGGCVLPFLLIFILPAFGVSSGVTTVVFIVLMLGCHLFMGHGDHGKDNHEQPKHH